MTARGRGVGFDAGHAAARALALSDRDLAGAAGVAAASSLLDGLDPARLAAITAIVDLGGAASVTLALDEIAEDLAAGRARSGAAASPRRDDDVAARRDAEQALLALWEAGILARDRSSRTFFVVPDLGAALVPALRERLVASLPIAPPPPPAIDEHLFLCAINALRHEPLKLTRDDVPFKRSLETLADSLKAELPRHAPLARVELLIAALVDHGMLQRRGETLEIQVGIAREWARATRRERERQVLAADSSGLASFILAQARDVAPDRAWPEEGLIRLVRRQILGGADPPAGLSAQGIALACEAALSTLERAGLIARTDAGLALTAAGRATESDGPGATDAAGSPVGTGRPARFHVGADLAVLVPRGLDASTHLALGAIARLDAADVVARYRLEQSLVLDALDRGETAASIEALLERATPSLPASVREDLRRWCARFGEITSHQGITLTCAPVERHAEFAAVVTGSGLAARMIGPGLALVEPADHAALCIALSASGFSPRATVLSASGPMRPRPVARVDALGGSSLAPDRLWGSRVDAGSGLQAAPPPGAFVARLKEKYRREFGGSRLASLDELHLDELLALEERGGIRGFLAGKTPGAVLPAARLDEFAQDELVSVSPVRARQVFELAMAAGLRCQVGHASRPGQSSRLLIEPLELIADTSGTWLRVRVAGGRERMLAIDRIHAVRVVRT